MAIETLAKRTNYGKHPLNTIESREMKLAYLKPLFDIVRLEDTKETMINRLVFVQWIVNESNLKLSLEYLMRYYFEKDTSSDLRQACYKCKLNKFNLLIDMLFVAYIVGTANEKVLLYISEICELLDIRVDEIHMYGEKVKKALLSNVKLDNVYCEMYEGLASPFSRMVGKTHLFNPFNMGSNNKNRTLVVEVPKKSVFRFKWVVRDNTFVRKGEPICEYYLNRYNEQVVKSDVSGYMYKLFIDEVYIGVVSEHHDNLADITNWLKQR